MIINHVKTFREKKGLSQISLATIVGVSRNSISSIERNEFIPKLDTAFKISEALNVPLTKLFKYQSRKEVKQ